MGNTEKTNNKKEDVLEKDKKEKTPEQANQEIPTIMPTMIDESEEIRKVRDLSAIIPAQNSKTALGEEEIELISKDNDLKSDGAAILATVDENGNSYLRIGSTVAYALDGDNGISAIIVVDEPTSTVKYGSVVAAPYISELMSRILPYLEYKSKAESHTYKVENYVGMNISSAVTKLKETKIAYEIVGGGSTVISQTPSGGDEITTGFSKVILYTEEKSSDYVIVPSLINSVATNGIIEAIKTGLSIKMLGNGSLTPDGNDIIVYQSIPPGEKVKRGSVIIIRIIHQGFED
jgi:stage V sporulation protein D (sporulation-specific penicillin-binding protein)